MINKKRLKRIYEAAYDGNIGFHEMFVFYDKATERQVDELETLIKKKRFKDAWKLVQKVTGMKLKGKEFSEHTIREVIREEIRMILKERKMSVEDALTVFGLTANDLDDKKLINKTYRTLALKNHPDKGGDLERMKDITVAKSVLDKATSRTSASGGIDWKAMEKEYSELAVKVLEILDDTFNPSAFTQYFQSVYGEGFEWEEINRFPRKGDRNPSYAGFLVEFFNKDRSIVFTFRVSAYLTNVKAGTKSLGSAMDSISFELMVDAYGLYGNKKLKVTQRGWKHTNRHSVLFKPEESFPKNKLEKFKKTVADKKFTKKDMVTALTSYFRNAEWDGEYVKIPIQDNIKLYLRRVVIMRMATWTPYLFERYRSVRGGRIASFPETEETLEKFKELHKELERGKDADDMMKRMNKWIDRNK